ncbi:MAG: hypothetical protein GY950_02070 [bacterium]|nr:hypothetical protein [bacterium]
MKTIHILLVFGLVLALLSGCATFGDHRYSGDTNRDIDIKTLALMLNDSLRRPSLKNKEIGILTFANLNNFDEAEPLGRHLQEKLSHALFDLGFRIIEIRLGKDIRFKPLIGELKLTRLKEILKRTEFAEIKSLVMGTYIDAGDYIYVNGKVVALENSTVMGSGEIKIRKGEYLHKLLNLEEDPLSDKTGVYERFPTKPRKTK